ncbi:MAG TPA: Na+/H+ antiporter NhaA [Gemmatimonadales bacterium]|nr:Na+/H+ antiporter NhaA [Gemmatimonadales bacterium]
MISSFSNSRHRSLVGNSRLRRRSCIELVNEAPQIFLVYRLGGIGFTMSLFIATLAFEATSLLDSAKVGIIAGSAISAVVGAVALRFDSATPPRASDRRAPAP